MKQILVIIVSTVLFSLGLRSQDYDPFPMENVNWNVLYAGTCNNTVPDTILLRYAIHGDTTINETVYAKLCLETGDMLNPEIQSVGGVREVEKKVYYIGQTIIGGGFEEEYLLYDFTKQTGDTITHDSQGVFKSVILEIDSILIGSNYRKRYKVDNHWFYHNPDYIVEGIGSVKNGLLGHISDIPTCGTHYWEHICFSKNGTALYLNPSFNDCFPENLLSEVAQSPDKKIPEIYPNPFSNELRVFNVHNSKEMIFRVIDLNGKTWVERSLSGGGNTFNLQHVSPGFYNATFMGERGEIIYRKKILKL